METMTVAGMDLFFEPQDRQAATLVADACEQTAKLIHEHWGLVTPEELHVHIMTDWLRSTWRSAPWPWRVLLAVSLPLWGPNARRTWPYAGGWEQAFGRRRTVGIKPPRLVQAADGSIGQRIFVPIPDIEDKVRSITCHELTHAFTSHLKLPTWLKEGVAMVTVDRFFEEPTVQAGTLQALERPSQQPGTQSNRQTRVRHPESLIYQVVRGYWITCFLEETQPALLRDLLSRRHSRQELESKLAAAVSVPVDDFWSKIDGLVVDHLHAP